jgi:hypothetical protein
MSGPAPPDADCRPEATVATIFPRLEQNDRAAFVTAGRTVSWADWLGWVEHLGDVSSALRRARVALRMRPSEKSYGFLLALRG